jgi:hypothetical protein
MMWDTFHMALCGHLKNGINTKQMDFAVIFQIMAFQYREQLLAFCRREIQLNSGDWGHFSLKQPERIFNEFFVHKFLSFLSVLPEETTALIIPTKPFCTSEKVLSPC